ncbi:MAG: hypothetical protein A2176_05490 [Spirochaetes bacterium RBG_13_51_14]|nr:MAG: hypothetical protein A2176_05490 [Spirochaetes bacterium RBG_13_51_14]
MRQKFFLPTISALLILSIALNVALYHIAVECYKQKKKYQIDPTGSLFYSYKNGTAQKGSNSAIRIVFFGDSRIHQWKPLPLMPRCELINRGMPGETTAQSLLRIDRDLLSLKPDIVVIELGVNDCSSIGALPEIDRTIIEKCKSNFDNIISMLHRKRIRTVVLTIFPASTICPARWPVWSENTREAIHEVNYHLMKKNSSDNIVINCDPIFLENRKMKREYAVDSFHINKDGYKMLNALIKPHLSTSKSDCPNIASLAREIS